MLIGSKNKPHIFVKIVINIANVLLQRTLRTTAIHKGNCNSSVASHTLTQQTDRHIVQFPVNGNDTEVFSNILGI